MTDTRPPQIFKNRNRALAWLQSEGVPVGRDKFYRDADDKGLIQPDKTVLLSDLLAYIKGEFGAGPAGPRRDMWAEERQRRLDEMEMEEKELKLDKLRREKRAEDEKWMLKEDAWAQMAGLVGLLRDGLKHHFHLGQGRLVHLAGGDPGRAPELYEGVEEILAKAFNEVARADRMEVIFEGEEE